MIQRFWWKFVLKFRMAQINGLLLFWFVKSFEEWSQVQSKKEVSLSFAKTTVWRYSPSLSELFYVYITTYYYFIDAILFYSLHKCTFDIMYFFIKTLLKWNDRLIYIKYIDPNGYNTYPLFSNQLAGWVSFNVDLIIVPQDISRVFQGLLRSDPRTIKDKASFTRLWIHEVSRVISDKLVDSNDREQFLGIVNYQLAKYFDTTYQLIVPFPPLVFCEWQC